ncbi:hypothetical protein pEaSNUABM8_00122 [Erwinia phage pEa_SNUABM_8]|nr:hypothetical protein pEaSNUABM8_00122 [Erwinia phage pEa_SNUABM_8]QVW54874.1 hypothetical protein pEaSNUABM4_00121 [Erwinia phage pEa_SNUABM_4]
MNRQDVKITLKKLNWINRFTSRLLALHGIKPEDLGLSRADLMKYAGEERDIDELIKKLMEEFDATSAPPSTPAPRKPKM